MRIRRLLEFRRTDLILFLHFFRDFFESDLLSLRDRLNTVFASVTATLASFGLLLPVLLNHKYRALNAFPTPTLYHQAALADKLMFIYLSMGLTAAATLLNWQSLFPDLRDFLILAPLPLERLQLFRAKLLAQLLFVTLLIVSINVLPAFSLTAIMSGRWQQPSGSFLSSMLQIASFFLACSFAAYFAFFTLLALQACLLNLLPPGWFARCSLAAQAVLLILTSAALPLAFWIPGLHSFLAAEPRFLRWLPPVWFLALGESLLGIADPPMRALAREACWSLCLALTLSLALYSLTYTRDIDRLLKAPAMNQAGFLRTTLSRVLNTCIRVPEETAIISFVLKCLLRSRLHKILVASILGACLSLVLDGFISLLIDRVLLINASGKPPSRA